MPRTTPSAVRDICADLAADPSISVVAAIQTANVLVTYACLPHYSDAAQLKEVETWLSAHFWSCDNPKLLEETIGRAKDIIQGKVDLGLRLTHYGQQALVLDAAFGGVLNDIASGKSKTIRMLWLGRTRTERERNPL